MWTTVHRMHNNTLLTHVSEGGSVLDTDGLGGEVAGVSVLLILGLLVRLDHLR